MSPGGLAGLARMSGSCPDRIQRLLNTCDWEADEVLGDVGVRPGDRPSVDAASAAPVHHS